MKLGSFDTGIIVGYLVLTVIIGFILTKRAAKGLNSYFMADKKLPFWILGVSDAGGMFDITGTMWLVYIVFVYGLKSIWLPWLWPVFNQIFLMVYMSKWMRRSNVMTGAEWISTRFGSGRGGVLAHLSVVTFALVSVIGFLAYGFAGIGKFLAPFLPWGFSPNTYAIALMLMTAVYVVAGGMYSVVITELLQFTVLTISSVAVAIVAMVKISPKPFRRQCPPVGRTFFSAGI